MSSSSRIAESSERKFGELKREYREQGLIEALRPESASRRRLNSHSMRLSFWMRKRAESKRKNSRKRAR